MKTITSDRFAPISSSAGFLEMPLETCIETIREWQSGLGAAVEVTRPEEPFPDALGRLDPLTSWSPMRELLVEIGEWTAYFNNTLQGTDAFGAVGHLSRLHRCRGLTVASVPHLFSPVRRPRGRMGAVEFVLYGPLRTDWLNQVRAIGAAYDGDRWAWNLHGTQQDYEDPSAYSAPKVRDRFTSDMLERYCQALGIDVFNDAAYGRTALIESISPTETPSLIRTLDEARTRADIRESDLDGQ